MKNLPLWIMLAGIAYAGYWYSQRPVTPIATPDTASVIVPAPAPPATPPPIVHPANRDHVSLDDAVSSKNDRTTSDHLSTDDAISPANDK